MRTNRDDILVHAGAILRMFDNAVESVGAKEMLTAKEYDVTREAWIAAVYLSGLRVITGKPWWLAINTIENSEQDIIGFSFNEVDAKRTERLQLPIQVFERTEDSTGDVFQSIKRKLDHTDLSNTSLVCYIKKREQIRLDQLHKSIMSIMPKPRVRDVWLIGNRVDDGRKVSIAQIFPNFDGRTLVIDLDQKQQDKNLEKTFLHPYRGFRKEKCLKIWVKKLFC